jgi:ABC-type Fe3+-hydroxamate transport system substrate-binding protein
MRITEVFYVKTTLVGMLLPQNFTPDKKINRIISLVPSLTELLYEFGLEDEVVGITKFCVHPAHWFKNKKRVGGTKNVKPKAIFELNPDLIIANKEENVKEQVESLAENFDVLLTEINDLQAAVDAVLEIGRIVDKNNEATILAAKIRNRFETLSSKVHSKRKKSAVYFIWKDPYMVAAGGTFINEMMGYCGFENIFSQVKRYPVVDLSEIKAMKFDTIILSTEPYPFNQTHKELFQNIF